jgi:hypothetical protein
MFASLTTLVSNGEISASMSKMRRIINGAAFVCEGCVVADQRPTVRVFAYILRFASLVGQQIYSYEVPDARAKLAFELHTYLWWLLVTYLSADVGGKPDVKPNTKRFHTQVICFFFFFFFILYVCVRLCAYDVCWCVYT